jgi:hypothetical protein
MTTDRSNPLRPSAHLAAVARDYPGLWRQVDELRADRGRGLPEWPAWCFLPLAGAYAIASGGRDLPPALGLEVGRIGALAAWRPTQGVYRYDPDVLAALWATPVAGDLPVEVLHRLPEWCVYIETLGREARGAPLHGYYAHLEWDANDGRTELRLLLDTDERLVPVPIHLAGAGLEGSLRAAETEAHRVADALGQPQALWPGVHRALAPIVEPLVSVLLYLCTLSAEVRDAGGGPRLPERPRPRQTKGGPRLYPPARPTTWDVAWRMGAALRRAQAEPDEGAGAAHRPGRPRPHFRRAHWHAYWTGPRAGAQQLVLRWLHPVLVAAEDAEGIVPTVHPVE